MILIDATVPMYLVGSDEARRRAVRRLVEGFIEKGERLVTDGEVVQEILHRCVAIRRREAIQPAVDVLCGIVDDILAITSREALLAKDLVLEHPRLPARAAIHLAVMRSHSIGRIASSDTGFDVIPEIERLD